jgi:hypothetical protein
VSTYLEKTFQINENTGTQFRDEYIKSYLPASSYDSLSTVLSAQQITNHMISNYITNGTGQKTVSACIRKNQ